MNKKQKTLFETWNKCSQKDKSTIGETSRANDRRIFPSTSTSDSSIHNAFQPTVHSRIPLAENGFDPEAGQSWIYPTNYPVRDYQFSIVQEALFKNTLVILPTGLGKTFIAAVVMFNIYRWYPKGKVVFMAPTRPLVAQQIDACYKVTGISPMDTTQMTGTTVPEERKRMWLRKRVFFLTPQVMVNDLVRNICPADSIKCLVVDEAHKALGNHAYCQVIRELQALISHFRVLALTATPGSDTQAVRLVLSNLLISHVEMRTEESEDVKPYTHLRDFEKIVVPLGDRLSSIKSRFLDVMHVYLKRLTQRGAMGQKNPSSLSKYQVLKLREEFGQQPPPNMDKHTYGLCMADFSLCISLYHAYELLLLHGARPFYNFLSGIINGEKSIPHARAELNKNFDFETLFMEVQENYIAECINSDQCARITESAKRVLPGHPKLEKLLEIVLEHFKRRNRESDGDTRVMIFSQYRDSVQEIVEMLNLHQPMIKAMSFIGQSSKSATSVGYSQKHQLKVIREFRSGGYNTLVSTCVGEEGLDIGEVDLIVCYDCPKSPIRLVQRMGRTGRLRRGSICILVAEGKEEQMFNSCESKKKSIHRAISKGFAFGQLYQNSPSLIPNGAQPQCVKKVVTVETVRATAKIKGKPREDGFLTEDELNEYNRCFKIAKCDGDALFQKSTFISLKSAENKDSTNNTAFDDDFDTPSARLSLSRWPLWQTTPQRYHMVSHSSSSLIFVKTLEKINFPPGTAQPISHQVESVNRPTESIHHQVESTNHSRIPSVNNHQISLDVRRPPPTTELDVMAHASPPLIDLCDDSLNLDALDVRNDDTHISVCLSLPTGMTDSNYKNDDLANCAVDLPPAAPSHKSLVEILFDIKPVPLVPSSILMDPVPEDFSVDDFSSTDTPMLLPIKTVKIPTALQILNNKLKARLKRKVKELGWDFSFSILDYSAKQKSFCDRTFLNLEPNATSSNISFLHLSPDKPSEEQNLETSDLSKALVFDLDFDSPEEMVDQCTKKDTSACIKSSKFDVDFGSRDDKHIKNDTQVNSVVSDINTLGLKGHAQNVKDSGIEGVKDIMKPAVFDVDFDSLEDQDETVRVKDRGCIKEVEDVSFSMKSAVFDIDFDSPEDQGDSQNVQVKDNVLNEKVKHVNSLLKSAVFDINSDCTEHKDEGYSQQTKESSEKIKSLSKQIEKVEDVSSFIKSAVFDIDFDSSEDKDDSTTDPVKGVRTNTSSHDVKSKLGITSDPSPNECTHLDKSSPFMDAKSKSDPNDFPDIDMETSFILDQFFSNNDIISEKFEPSLTQPLSVKKIVLESGSRLKKNSSLARKSKSAVTEQVNRSELNVSSKSHRQQSPWKSSSCDNSFGKKSYSALDTSATTNVHDRSQYSLTQLVSMIDDTESVDCKKDKSSYLSESRGNRRDKSNYDSIDNRGDKSDHKNRSSDEDDEVEPTPPREAADFLYRANSLDSIQKKDTKSSVTKPRSFNVGHSVSFDLSHMDFDEWEDDVHFNCAGSKVDAKNSDQQDHKTKDLFKQSDRNKPINSLCAPHLSFDLSDFETNPDDENESIDQVSSKVFENPPKGHDSVEENDLNTAIFESPTTNKIFFDISFESPDLLSNLSDDSKFCQVTTNASSSPKQIKSRLNYKPSSIETNFLQTNPHLSLLNCKSPTKTNEVAETGEKAISKNSDTVFVNKSAIGSQRNGANLPSASHVSAAQSKNKVLNDSFDVMNSENSFLENNKNEGNRHLSAEVSDEDDFQTFTSKKATSSRTKRSPIQESPVGKQCLRGDANFKVPFSKRLEEVKKVKSKTRRKNVYLLSQAAVSGSEDSDEGSEGEGDDFDNSFIDDDDPVAPVNQQAMYMQSVKNIAGLPQRFKMRSNERFDEDVLSQLPNGEPSMYMYDSFCVGDDEVIFSSSSDDESRRKVTAKENLNNKRKRIITLDSSSDEEMFVKKIRPTPPEDEGSMRDDICPRKPKSKAILVSSDEEENDCQLLKECSRNMGPLPGVLKQPSLGDVSASELNKPLSLELSCGDDGELIGLNFSFDIGWDEEIPHSTSEVDINDATHLQHMEAAQDSNQTPTNIDNKSPLIDTSGASAIQSKATVTNLNCSTPMVSSKDNFEHCESFLSSKSSVLGNSGSNFNSKVVLVDSRELSSGKPVVSSLRNRFGLDPVVMQLTHADYILSNRLAVERFYDSDFPPSATPWRVIEKVSAMSDLYEQPFVIIEADTRKKSLSFNKLAARYLQFAVGSALHSPRVRILYSSSMEETSSLISELVEGERKKGFQIGVPVTLNASNQRLFDFYSSIPKVSTICALNLLYHLPSVRLFFRSSEQQLKKAGAISSRKAAHILQYLRSELLFDPFTL